MDFRDDVNLDPSQVEDRGYGGGGGFPGGGVVIGGGGGIVGLIVLVLIFVLNNVGGVGVQPGHERPPANLAERCRTGKEADQIEKCQVVGVVNSIQDYWKTQLTGYRLAKTVLYSGGVRTACGAADSSVGPFYCPADRRVYLDLTFFDDLESRFGAKGGPFAQAYVIAHEYGHHVQNLLGLLDAGSSVAIELQADCFAGVWARNAYEGGFYAREFTRADIAEALDAATAVGDDRIQRRSGGRVDPESFTHGSSKQRTAAFQRGYDTGNPARCEGAELV